jgi:hypothetical protein
MRLSVLVAALALAPILPAAAQAPAAPTRQNALSLSPVLGIPFTFVTFEYERAVVPTFSLAPYFSYFEVDDGSYTSFALRGRFYPGEEAPQGFSVGLVGGATRIIDDDICCDIFPDPGRASGTYPTLEVTLDYNFLVGKTDRFLIATGVGGKRIFVRGDDYDLPTVYPTFRFQLGFTF